jgi:hypothetical protein
MALYSFYLIDHPEVWTAIGREGRKHMEMHYYIYNEIENLGNIYNNLD